ncbi:MAG: NADP oxidoreductase, partial [Deltaproteobacteria bacterium]|nr:NADP oxidoreductase [Deltaproteobacteria bacterium]
DCDLLKVVREFLRFFSEESCGYCTPCRVGTVLLQERLERLLDGRGEVSDLTYLQDLGMLVKTASRCGLGQTAANPVLSSLANFRSLYEARVVPEERGFVRGFDLNAAMTQAAAISGRSLTPSSEDQEARHD